jgi:hypothetical protein
MSVAKVYDISVKVGSYKDREGQEKALWRTVGAYLESDKGPFLKLDASFNPAGIARNPDGSVYLSLFKPQAKPERGGGAPARGPAPKDEGDDIPFITNGDDR